jgi:(E)-4-hydroxy-3-methylbut-2-enyl-diphosphate synthase
VIADIHFQPKYVFAAIGAGCAAVRVNPGNIRKFATSQGDRRRRFHSIDPDRGQRGVAGQAAAASTARRRRRPKSSPRCGRRACSPSTTSTTSEISVRNVPRGHGPATAARAGVRLPAAPGRHRAIYVPGRSSRRSRSETAERASAHDPGVAVSAPVRSGRHADPQSLNLRPRNGDRVVPSCGRAQSSTTGGPGHRRARRLGCYGCGDGLRGERSRRGPRADLGASGNGKGRSSSAAGGQTVPSTPSSRR